MEAAPGIIDLIMPGGVERSIHLERRVIHIGRGKGCDIWLPDISVSRRHARLECVAEDAWRLVDLGSSNGTFVNGKHVHLFNLADGDVIQIGNCRMILRLSRENAIQEAELDLVLEDEETLPIRVESDDLPPDAAVPPDAFSGLNEAMNRLGKPADQPSLLTAIASEFCLVLRPDRLAVGIESQRSCHWPVVCDAAGHAIYGDDLPRRLVPKIQGSLGVMPLQWDTPLSGTAPSGLPLGRATKRCYLFPLRTGTRRMGYVYAERRDPGWEPGHNKLHFLALLAREAALLLDRVAHPDDRRAAEEARRELESARALQLDLFPRTLELDARLDIAAENHPSFAVSGDYYDCQLTSPGQVVFIIADAMGHGPKASLLMSQLQAVFRTGVWNGCELHELDIHLDEVMRTSSRETVFASGILGLCDPGRGTLSILCAGHRWPSILIEGVHLARIDSAHTSPWGIAKDLKRPPPAQIALAGRWSLLAYTDGVTEASNEFGSPYSVARVEAFHAKNANKPAKRLCEELLDDLLLHTGRASPLQDDVTVLAICGRN